MLADWLKVRFSLTTQAKAHAESWFLFHRENDLDAGINKRAQGSKCFLFLVLSLMLALALQHLKTKYRSGISQAQGYLPHVVMFRWWKQWIPNTSRVSSFSKTTERFWLCLCLRPILFHLIAALVPPLVHASLVKTRLIFVTLMRLPVVASLVRIGLERLAWNIFAPKPIMLTYL